MDLISRLDLDTRVQLYSIPAEANAYNEKLNLKSYLWDITCIHGLSKVPSYSSVFPHAIALGASWDLDLVQRISQATALEGRIVQQIHYRETQGQQLVGVQCDGGPLANTATDPRWGRISETYGEDPYLCSQVGCSVVLLSSRLLGLWPDFLCALSLLRLV
jgi:beta-glucosidase